jgi:hypothetical protein
MGQVVEITETERVQAQTTDEWLEELNTGKKVFPKSLTVPVQEIPVQQVVQRFDSHRTTKRGVVFALINTDTAQEVDAFFNADTTHQRGRNRGKHKRTGKGGEFLPTPGSKFRKFWIDVIGTEPLRWSAVQKELRSKLKNLSFTGELTVGYTKDGAPFNKVENLRLMEQRKNNFGTTLEQERNNHLEQRFASIA